MLALPWAVAAQPPCVLPCSHHTNIALWLGLKFWFLSTLESKMHELLQGDMDITCNHQQPPWSQPPPAFLLSFHQLVTGHWALAMPGSGNMAVVAEGWLLRAVLTRRAGTAVAPLSTSFNSTQFPSSSGQGLSPTLERTHKNYRRSQKVFVISPFNRIL